MSHNINFPEKISQSKEITEALRQYTGLVRKHWDRFVVILLNEYKEMSDRYKKENKRMTVKAIESFFHERAYNKDFLMTIDTENWQRVVDSFRYIFNHPLVMMEQGKSFKDMNLLERAVSFDEKKEILRMTINLSDIFRHYMPNKMIFEYDPLLCDSFNKKVTANLYKRGCLVVAELDGVFELSEREIRLMLSLDDIEDIEHLAEKNISSIDDLPVIISDTYSRFDNFIKYEIEPALEEIRKAYLMGRCPFYLEKEHVTIPVSRRGRGGLRKLHSIRFYLRHAEDDTGADIIVVNTEPVQTELFPDQTETGKKINAVAERILGVFKRAGYSYGGKYKTVIISDIKARFSVQPNLSDAVLAWIDYCEWFISRKGLPEKERNEEVAKFMQKKLMTELNLVYWSRDAARKREQRLHEWDGTPTVKFPPEKNDSLVRLADIAESIKADAAWRKDVMEKNALSDAALNYLMEEFTDYFKDREYQDIADVKDKFDYWLQGEGGKIALVNFENQIENVTQLNTDNYGKANISISTRKEPNQQAQRVKRMFDE